jgi:hypothetical protein
LKVAAVAVLAVLTAARAARAEPQAGWAWGAVPIVNFDADAGVGVGGVGTLTRHARGLRPYRASLLVQLFATSEKVQGHELKWDVVAAGHPRLRAFGRVGYFATVNRNYCGLGNAVTCDPADAEAAADAAGIAPGTGERDDFVRRFHRVRFVDPFGQAGGRWRLDDRGVVSAFAQWRLWYFRPGTLSERGPYPGSLYARDHPDGEPGLASVPQLGVMVDTRDDEASPSRGVWIEASVRGAGRATGSTWSFAGGNLTARGYLRLGHAVVSATRVVVDGVAGDLPVPELGLVNAADTYVAFGGAAMGRGVREHRFIGRIKLLGQQELRAPLSRRWVAVGFVDAGWIAVDWDDVGGDPGRILWTTGGGLRFIYNPTFILRADLGVSPVEGWSPQVYLYLGHLY